ncbi:MAG: alpha/beta hydrolase, partial [Muribaculaceae bacterium]|nr:alpha/beta hydrolase [Muribaculaceae bacterium]
MAIILPITARSAERSNMIKETYDYAVKDADTLRLDVYYNPTVAYQGKRPIIIFSFGGGWEAGARADGAGSYTPFLNTMTDYGYVTVGIDYRLGYLDARKSGRVEDKSICYSLVTREMDRNIYDNVASAIANAVEDLYDATTYIVENADRWNADPQCIVIGGISAGGINSITAENMCANADPLAMAHLPENFRYAGVISGCGAIWHDADRPIQWLTEPCPTLFLHGDSDNIVPYDRWAWDGHNFHIDGAASVSSYYKDNNIPYMLVTGAGGGHDYGGYAFAHDQDLINRFITNFVINKSPKSIEIKESPLP